MIKLNQEEIVIRPSSIDTFFNCSFQWAKVFLEGITTIPNARAAIGTAIHKGVEEMWLEAQLTQQKDSINLSMITDAAIEEFQNLDSDGLNYDNNENCNTAEDEVVHGTRAFVEDIVPYTDIPLRVEQRHTIKLNHPIVTAISGTLDYESKDTIADVKTSKRKPVAQSYVTQQSIYKFLAEENGSEIKHSMIQGVALTKNPTGHILELEPNIPRAKYLVNTMLDALEAFYNGVDPKLLFRGNPKYYLCSPKYCSLYNGGCPYVKGDD